MSLPSDPTADAPLQTTPTRHRVAEGEAALAVETRILGPLNEVQRRAVTTTKGPLLVLAGAGSGKTRVITHRIAWLIDHEGVAPWRILAVTFTNKAAAEMRDRLEGMIGQRARDVAMGTFHSLCVRMLRRDGEAIGLPKEFAIYDADDQARVIKGFLKEDDLPATGSTKPSLILGAISRAKNDGLTPDQMEDQAVTHHERLIAGFARRYAKELKRLDALDFDDLLIEGLRLLQEAPAVAERYRTKWEYLHVDEYQDTNRIQYAWIRELAAGHGNLCVVGDDDQSIYSWRGADIRNILDFERDWPKAEVIALEQNYRSTQSILDAAHGVVSNNLGRKAKKLWTDQSGGLPIPVYGGFDQEDEAAWIVRRIEEHAAPRKPKRGETAEVPEALGGIAILYRTNAQSRAIEEALLRASIPYQLIGGTRFYQRREVKDALAWLRVLRSDTDRISHERIINVPPRGIGEKTVDLLRAAAAPHPDVPDGLPFGLVIAAAGRGEVAGISSRARTALAGVADVIARLRSRLTLIHLPELLDAVYSETGLRAHLASEGVEGEERWANLLELRGIAGRFLELEPLDALDRFIEETALVADQDSLEEGTERVTLITLHAAKGLEWPTVFISGLVEGLFPHSRALMDEEQMEEERRLCYVGITRAKRRLTLSYAIRRGWGDGDGVPSRFLAEIPEELLEVANDEDPRSGGATRFGRGVPGFRSARAGFAGGESWREGSGEPGAPAGEFTPSRDLEARRRAYGAGARSGSLRLPGEGDGFDEGFDDAGDDPDHDGAPMTRPIGRIPPWANGRRLEPSVHESDTTAALPERRTTPARVRIPGERYFRDGDRVQHPRFGSGIVVTSKLTRSDEEVTIAFVGVGVKTLAASIAGLEIV
ncbi:MAG: ATP-dependent DNA helicase PcrA [Candidatus Limnocylindrus sp. ZSMar2m-chloro-G89]|nr:MAG: ATP-dependent DNA helicase PcrA [Candidatus Limnocylindrus sp. ZSMar2m-chloro-G89]